ncbi:hypothetical protein ACFE04_010033 [Oxalis oulophora]
MYQYLFCAAYGRIILLLFLLTITLCNANNKKKTIQCEKPSSCGDIPKISYPFRLHDDPKNCGDPNYELFCENNTTVRYVFSDKFIVQSINYEKGTIRVVHEDLQKNNCSTIPRYSLSSYLYPFIVTEYYHSSRYIIFLGCEHQVKSSRYISISPCLNTTKSSPKKKYSYAFTGDFDASDVEDSCSIDMMIPTSSSVNCKNNCSYLDVQSQMSYGVESAWSRDTCEICSLLLRVRILLHRNSSVTDYPSQLVRPLNKSNNHDRKVHLWVSIYGCSTNIQMAKKALVPV